MANFILDQKGRLLTTVFPDYRGDASIGGQEVIEVTVDFSQVGANNTIAQLGTQSGLPNSGLGLAAADTLDIAVLPYNFQVQSVAFIADTNAPTPDVYPIGVTAGGAAGTLTALTYSLGRYAVSAADRSTAATITTQNGTAFTAAATTYASSASLVTGSVFNGSALAYTTGTDFLPYITPAASGSMETIPAVYVLRLTIGTITGTTTNLKVGKFRFRIAGIAYNI